MVEYPELISPIEPALQLPDGAYVRPAGRPPIDGYSWNPTVGVWLPGKRLLLYLEQHSLTLTKERTGKRSLVETESKTKKSSTESSTKKDLNEKPKVETTKLPVDHTELNLPDDGSRKRSKLSHVNPSSVVESNTREDEKEDAIRDSAEILDEQRPCATSAAISRQSEELHLALRADRSKERANPSQPKIDVPLPLKLSLVQKNEMTRGTSSILEEASNTANTYDPTHSERLGESVLDDGSIKQTKLVLLDESRTREDGKEGRHGSVVLDKMLKQTQLKRKSSPCPSSEKGPVADKDSRVSAETRRLRVERAAASNAPKIYLDSDSSWSSSDRKAPPKVTKARECSLARTEAPLSTGIVSQPTFGNSARPRTETDSAKDQRKSAPESRFHPTSDWEEPCPGETEPTLTLYEKHRRPRPIPTGIVRCSIKALRQEFQCTICCGYIRKARLVSECLHRFCEQCIEKTIEQAGRRNECPICRTFIPSRRSLAPDPGFDRLIEQVLGDELNSPDKEYQRGDMPPTMILQQAIHRKKMSTENVAEHRQMVDSSSGDRTFDTRAESTPTTGPNHEVSPLVKLELVRSPDETQLDDLHQRYLALSGDATIRVVENFLKQKLGFMVDSIEIMSMWRGRPKILHHTATLHAVVSGMTDNYDGSYMPLFFRGRAADAIQMNDLLILN